MLTAPLLLQLALSAPALQDDPHPESTDEGVVVTVYHENGAKAREGRIARGRRVGQWTAWHPNGQAFYRGEYKDYERVGSWIFWRPNGKKRSEGTLSEGLRQGRWIVSRTELPAALHRVGVCP